MVKSRQAVVRAAAITCVLVWQGIDAAPLPHRVTKDDLRNPVAQEELAQWSDRLAAVGLPIEPDALGARVITVSTAVADTRDRVLAPMSPVARWVGMGQGWALFADPDTYPSRLSIRVRRADGWHLMFENLDPDHAWADPVLRYRRVRACYDAGSQRTGQSGSYRRFARWIAGRILAEDPNVDEVQVRVLRTHTTLPGAPADPKVEVRHVVHIPRPPG